MGNEIALYQRVNDPLAACQQWGVAFCASGMFGFTKPEQGYVAALVMLTEGLTPFQFKKKYHVTPGGNIIPKAHHILAEFLAAGGAHKWLKDGEDGMAARIRLEMKGREPVEYEYTIDMAKKAKLVRADSVWEKDPGKMLRARCESSAVAMIAPEILTGLEDDDDAQPQTTTTVTVSPLFPEKPSVPVAPAPIVEAEIVHAPPKPAGEPDAETQWCIDFQAKCRERGADFESKAIRWLQDKNYVQKDAVFPGALKTITPDRKQKIAGAWDAWCKNVEESYK